MTRMKINFKDEVKGKDMDKAVAKDRDRDKHRHCRQGRDDTHDHACDPTKMHMGQ